MPSPTCQFKIRIDAVQVDLRPKKVLSLGDGDVVDFSFAWPTNQIASACYREGGTDLLKQSHHAGSASEAVVTTECDTQWGFGAFDWASDWQARDPQPRVLLASIPRRRALPFLRSSVLELVFQKRHVSIVSIVSVQMCSVFCPSARPAQAGSGFPRHHRAAA